MEASDIIRADDLRRHYGPAGAHSFEAVRGVSFSVRRGESFALLGTNGAGKTSTLEMLEGLAAPSSGTVRVLGHDPARDRRLVRPSTGVVLQRGGLPGELTVVETTRMWARTLTAPRPVREALDLVDLTDRADVLVKQLSGGERRRLDLALALLGRPEILFLDEPTSGLDPASRSRIWRLVRDLLDSGTTVFLTTHYLEEAEQLADRLAILHRGRLVTSGTPAEITASHPSRISFTLPAEGSDSLPGLPGVIGFDSSGGDNGSGQRYVARTNDLQVSLIALLDWARVRNLALGALDARAASLEEAFLAIATTASAAPDEKEMTA